MNKTDLAKKLGIGRGTLYRYEREDNYPVRGTIVSQQRWIATHRAKSPKTDDAQPDLPMNGDDSTEGMTWNMRKTRAMALKTELATVTGRKKILDEYREELMGECKAFLTRFRDKLHRLKLTPKQSRAINTLISECLKR